jgi:DNA end-binding protein Ku
MAHRATWSGSVTFGLVNVPIKLYLAADEQPVRFNQLHKGCGARIRMPKRCENGHDISGTAEIDKGYPISKDEYVVVDEQDFAALPLASKDAVEIVRFIPNGAVSPEQYLKSYFVAPEPVGEMGYALLVKAMTDEKVSGLAKVAFRESREHLALVRVEAGRLILHTLFWPDEVREWPMTAPKVKLDKEAVGMAKLLVESLAGPYEPAALHDDYREKLLEVIDAKVKGTPIKVEPRATGEPGDLMAALAKSVEKQRKARKAS